MKIKESKWIKSLENRPAHRHPASSNVNTTVITVVMLVQSRRDSKESKAHPSPQAPNPLGRTNMPLPLVQSRKPHSEGRYGMPWGTGYRQRIAKPVMEKDTAYQKQAYLWRVGPRRTNFPVKSR